MKSRRLLTYLLLSISITTFAQLIEINNAQHYQQILQENKPTLVKFAAEWCGVCQGVKKPFEQIAHEKEFNNVTFAQVNIDTMSDLSKENNIAGVPTFVYINNGKQVSAEVGVQNMVTFKDDLRANLRKTFNLAQNKTTEIEQDEPTSGQIENIEKPVEKNTQQSQGFVGMIKDFFSKIIELVRKVIKYIVDKITGIFR